MEYEDRCPVAELGALLPYVTPEGFKTLQRPDKREYDAFLEKEHAYLSPVEKEETYADELFRWSEFMKGDIVSELFQYGKNRRDIVENLGQHVERCMFCTDEYAAFLIGVAEHTVNPSILSILEGRSTSSSGRVQREDLYRRSLRLNEFYLDISKHAYTD